MSKLLIAFILCTAAFAHASVDSIRADEQKCLDTAIANNDMKQCVFKAYDAADKELNVAYAEITKNLKSEVAKATKEATGDRSYDQEILNRLVKSERAWITFRDANCSLESTDMLFGSGEGLSMGGCLSRVTMDRITELQKMFSK